MTTNDFKRDFERAINTYKPSNITQATTSTDVRLNASIAAMEAALAFLEAMNIGTATTILRNTLERLRN